MIQCALFGKDGILEKATRSKKYSGFGEDDEQTKNAQFELRQSLETMITVTNPEMDPYGLGPKIATLKLKLPTDQEFDLLNSVLVKNFTLFVRFSKLEIVPGRPDHEFGIGFMIDTTNIFFEEKIYKDIEKVTYIPKLGGIFKEKQVSKEKVLKDAGGVFGKDFSEAEISVLDRGKDNRGVMRFGLRILYNVHPKGRDTFWVDRLSDKWSNDNAFLSALVDGTKKLEKMLNQIYITVGYETPPDFFILLGDLISQDKIQGFTKEDVKSTPIITICETGGEKGVTS